jgi:hypothetical protein
MNKITKEKLKTWHGLTVGDLKKFIENNNVPDDALVMIERVDQLLTKYWTILYKVNQN